MVLSLWAGLSMGSATESASRSFGVEGAAAEDGRKPSIWDTYAHAGNVFDKSTGDIAADQYHKYKEDVKLMHEMGLDAYRFSISWSRLIPDGRGAINPKGLQYYNNLINELVRHGIEAHVTLNHFDLPQALEDEYGGYLSQRLIEDFTAYADICFKEFGDRVKYWSTFNEPTIQAIMGYDLGVFPPKHCSFSLGFFNCSKGNSTEVYISAHNMLLSHAAAVQLYREKYQEKQKGYIGITLLGIWFEPLTNSTEDVTATKRVIDFQFGWFLDPLVYGNYPATMRKIVGSRLPSFIEDERKQLKGSFDFIGLNHYLVVFVQNSPDDTEKYEKDYATDISARISIPGLFEKDFISLKTATFPTAPWALQRLLEYVKLYYENAVLIIHENGYPMYGNNSYSPDARNDDERVDYLQKYIESLLQSIRDGSNTRGYFVWSFVDCFELTLGYTVHYGLYQVDFNNRDRKRYPTLSAQWYTSFLGNSKRKRGNSESLSI
ncbi:beta-glucosidase 31-like isoform X2 [Magnolia sinica]|uniref:beta-glucosidase 31-like isoform X2 n=1 Tax=Magnolia sinica TaxID=86752 RepID=UPI00265B36B4|nr:beta-glucosidase 31-like isoform X2 [Magnolia sinica]